MPRKTPVSVLMASKLRTIDVDAKLSDVRRALIANDFHHMPIVEAGQLVGMISWRDLVRAYRASRRDEGMSIEQLLDDASSIRELMSTELVTLPPDASVERAIDLIAKGQIHSVLIVDANEQLVGIVTDKNLVEYLAS
jgi:acetoin utilization protein AcuB